MKVLVTGHRGYLGSVLTTVLQRAGHEVVGLDVDWYRGCDFGLGGKTIPDLAMDIRDVEAADLISFDAVIHLAALSDDATTDLDPALAKAINHTATIRLAECSRQAGVARFLFASSCSVYGRGGCECLTEEGPLNPLSLYAKLKLRCEQELALLANEVFSPVFLRCATLYGISPRLRLDLVVNDFAASAVAEGRVAMRTLGHAVRPLVHVEDAARLYTRMLGVPVQQIHNQVFNVVDSDQNHRVIDIADTVCEMLPGWRRPTAQNVLDPRSYHVDGSKLRLCLPEFRFEWTLLKGIKQLLVATERAGMTPAEWRSDRYRRTLRLCAMREQGELDANLRFPQHCLSSCWS